ncbi:MAG: hypothetical protein Q9201_005411 [Fulgogasparrea decipioides]
MERIPLSQPELQRSYRDVQHKSHKVPLVVPPTTADDDKATAYSKLPNSTDLVLSRRVLITGIYGCCLQIFHGILRMREGEKSTLLRLRTEAERFALWGKGFDALRGGLDKRLRGADLLKTSLCNILMGTGEVLMSLVRYLGKDEGLAATCSRLQHLKTLVPEELINSTRPGDQGFDDVIMASLDELNSETPASGTDEVEELLRDLESYNTCLYGLVPVLEEPTQIQTSKRNPEALAPFVKGLFRDKAPAKKGFTKIVQTANKDELLGSTKH